MDVHVFFWNSWYVNAILAIRVNSHIVDHSWWVEMKVNNHSILAMTIHSV